MPEQITVSEQGLSFATPPDEPVDVLFDDQRVWSTNPARDAAAEQHQRVVRWPTALQPLLEGRTEVTLRAHVSGTTHFRASVTFGGSNRPLRVVDPDGHPLAVDKGGRLQRTFSHASDSVRASIITSVEEVLHDLRHTCGLEAFLSYGCLLGGVRDGHMIGHDSDADLSYVSRYTHPFDIIRETDEAERAMRSLGWRTVRMSGADFKIWVGLDDGRRCGVDVFGSFYIGGVYYLTASRGGRLPLSALFPLGTVELEGREIPAPRDVEAYLTYIYGPGWRVPDPSFKFTKDPGTVRRMRGWLRGSRENLRHWQEFYGSSAVDAVPAGQSMFASWVSEQLSASQHVVDAGTGTGRDALWLAGRGHHVLAADYVSARFPEIRALAGEQDLDVSTHRVNFNNARSVLVSGAGLAHAEQPYHVYARMLLDALVPQARHWFWRWAQMSQRRGGLTFLEFRTHNGADEATRPPGHHGPCLDPDEVQQEVRTLGGRVEARQVARGLAPLGEQDPEVCRMTVRWTP